MASLASAMANVYPEQTNGPRNGTRELQNLNQVHRSISRPLTLQESLPFSPQTSTVPFLAEITPDPIMGAGSPVLRIAEGFPRDEFDKVNMEATSQLPGARNLKQATDYVLRDLKPTQRTHYKFPVLSADSLDSSARSSLSQELSPLSRSVFDKVGSFFKSTKPNVASPKAINGESLVSSRSITDAPSHGARTPSREVEKRFKQQDVYRSPSTRLEVAIPSKRNFDSTAFVETIKGDPPTDHKNETLYMKEKSASLRQSSPQQPSAPSERRSSSTGKVSGFSIVLPSTKIKREEYLEIADTLEAPCTLSTRRRNGNGYSDHHNLPISSLDQQQRGDVALDELDGLTRAIFDAVGAALASEPDVDHIATINANGDAVMTVEMQQKMHTSLHKVIGLKCFQAVPVESLLHIMKLSDASLKQAEEFETRVDIDWDENAVESWFLQLPELDSILKAARICLRILSGGRDDKQLYSETVIHRCMDVLKNVMEDIIMPLVELRNVGTGACLFKSIQKQKKTISSLFLSCQKVFALLAELVTKIQLSESVINTLEYTASKLIFVDNAYMDKDSAVGAQKFDGIRSIAMGMLCQIFLIKPGQRQGIIDDILTSLEKLSVGKVSSRQFKLSDGGSIQPVSALIMRLVQASSGRVEAPDRGVQVGVLPSVDQDKDRAATGGRPDGRKREVSFSILDEEQGAMQHAVAIQELEMTASPLNDCTNRNASYVTSFIVKRAIGSTKSGDTPYRNLLDNFVEDFTTCLDSPDWPSAELLLRSLMILMVQLFEAGKTAVPAKNMALELLGTMSAAISRLRSQVKKTAGVLEGSGTDELSRYLSDLAVHVLEQKSPAEHIFAWSGPYRAVVEYLQSRCSDDTHLSGAVSFMTMDWATKVHVGYDNMQEDDKERDSELGRMAIRLRTMLMDPSWLSNEYAFKPVTASQAKFAFSILLLRSSLCESFGKILNILMSSMASDQVTVRSKSLKSISQVLKTDPSILDGESSVIQLILDCSSDSSSQVRDSALGLLGNCIGMRPVLEMTLAPKIIERFQDAGVGVRKRAMKLARDIYLRNRNKALRSAIASGLLRRIQDPDEGVRDLARQMIEEVWFAPFYSNEDSAAFTTSLTEHVALIIKTVKSGTVTDILDWVFQTILRPNNRSLEGPFSVCSRLVGIMFGLIDNPDSEEAMVPSGRDALQVLTIFAKADPKLFNFEQIRLLRPQLASFAGREELAAFRAVTVIYKRVLPQLATVHADFLTKTRLQLLKGVGKISSRGALDDLTACADAVCSLLRDFAPLANLVASSLLGMQKLGKGPIHDKRLHHLSAYAIIVGSVGKNCNLDRQLPIFENKFPQWQGDSVPQLIVDTLVPFAAVSQPLEARKAAIEAIGLVCQSWPRNYVLAKVYTTFQQVFQDRVPILEMMILRSFKEFLVAEEKRTEAGREAGDKGAKELAVMGGTNFDDVASATTQRFLKEISRIAMATQDEHAFLAMEVLGSINRQGLTHPKETGVTLMTLETSANRKIAELAYSEHRALHEKHETVLEREYARAVHSAHAYQRDIVKDSHGATTEPFQSKLHLLLEVMKISKMKNRQRFLDKLCSLVNFELGKLDASGTFPGQVDFARFILENMAFFEYQTVGELQSVVQGMESIVTSTGATVAQAIESEVFGVRMDVDGPNSGEEARPADKSPNGGTEGEEGAATGFKTSVEESRFRQLTAGSMILLGIWEVRTYLRKLHGMGTSRHEGKAKGLAKELNKSPTKVAGVHGDKFWEDMATHMGGLQSREAMVRECSGLVELMNVDAEFKVADDEEEAAAAAMLRGARGGTPMMGEDDEEEATLDRGRKRKGTGTTPAGRKKRARSGSQLRKRG